MAASSVGSSKSNWPSLDLSAVRCLQRKLQENTSVSNENSSVGTQADIDELVGCSVSESDSNFFLSVAYVEPFVPVEHRRAVLDIQRLEAFQRYSQLLGSSCPRGVPPPAPSGKVDLLNAGGFHAPWPNECLQCLSQYRVPDLNKLRKGRTVLHTQIMRGHVDVCLAILARCDFSMVNVKDRRGTTALYQAASSGYHAIVTAILRRPDFHDVNGVCFDGCTALTSAAGSGHYLVCEALLRHHEIDVNYTERPGWTAAHCAAYKGHSDCCSLILSHPKYNMADVVVRSGPDGSPIGNVRDLLVMADRRRKKEVASTLLIF